MPQPLRVKAFAKNDPYREKYGVKAESKTKRQLADEVADVRREAVKLEMSDGEHRRIEWALRESEERYRTLVENSLAGIYIRQGDKILFASSSFCRILGYSWEELTEMRFIDLVHPDDRPVAGERAKQRMLGEEPAASYQCRTLTKNGDVLWVEVFGTQIDYDGKPAVLGNFIDITERKKAEQALRKAHDELGQHVELRTRELATANEDLKREIFKHEQTEKALRESEEKYRLLLENTGLSVTYYDLDGKTLLINNVGAKNLGGVPEDLVGKTLLELFGPDAANVMLERVQRIVDSDKGSEHEDMIQLPSGPRWFWSLLRPVRRGTDELIGVQVTSHDITERKKMEEALREAKGDLEKKVEDRTEELREKTEELEMFTFFISHDLQLPLRNMENLSQSLAEGSGERLGERYRKELESFGRAAKGMNELIDDMMTYARLGIQDFSKTDIPLKSIITDAQFPLLEDIVESGGEIHISDSLPVVRGHERTLVRLMANLLSNAIKFVPPDRAPKVHIEATRSENTVRVSVRDNGIGIDPEYREKIFRIFERLHSRHDYPGTGVGLAIVKKAAQLHGGTVGVESEEGKGSTFWFEIPD
jgi:PAS domain S-box-containing protein